MSFLPNLLLDFFLIFFPITFLLRGQKNSLFLKRKARGKEAFAAQKNSSISFWIAIKKALKELGIGHAKAKFFFKKTTALFLTLFAVAFILGLALYAIGINDTERVFETINAIKQSNTALLFYLLFVRVTAEEIFFRGFLAKKTGILFSSAAFAAAHVFYGSIAEIIGAFFLGLVLAHYFLKNKNLLPNIFAHIFYNLFTLIIAYSIRA